MTGRSSGRSLTYPIWFAVEGDKLYLIPVKGSDTEWYKNVRKIPTIRLSASGSTGNGVAVRDLRWYTVEMREGERAWHNPRKSPYGR